MARYVKVLIDKGVNSNNNGLLTVSELRLFNKNVNVALNKSVQVSSFLSSHGARGSNMVDGGEASYQTSWATDHGTGLTPNGSQWAIVDLGSNYRIERIEFCTFNGQGFGATTDYRIMFSNDNVNYWLATQVTGKPATTRTDIHRRNQ